MGTWSHIKLAPFAENVPTAAWRKTADASDNRVAPSRGPCGIRRRVTKETRLAMRVETISAAASAECAARPQPTPDNMNPAKTASEKTAAASNAVMTVHHCRSFRLG